METYSSSKTQSWLSWFLRGVLILGFFILFAKLFDLQIIRGSYFKKLSEGNRIRRVPIAAPRGKILARGAEVLVGNREIRKKVVFYPDKGYEKTTDLKGANPDEIIIEPLRDYVLGADFAHVSGYLGEVNESEVGKIDPECLEKGPRKLGSLIGRSGLEQMYECTLSGFDGEELIEVDSVGRKIRVLGKKEPVAGEDIKTTIHYGLQRKVADIMSGRKQVKLFQETGARTIDGEFRGAVVVTDTHGEVMAIYSSPSFNPNYFVTGSDKVDEILKSRELPLLNRVIAGKFHPGSIFKPIVATAALEGNAIDKDYTYVDTGEILIETIYGKFSYTNWYFTQYGGTEGEINLTRAIARSTDTFFYKLGELVGIDNLVKWSGNFGLNEVSGIDLPGEITSLIPSPEWKQEVKGERWFLGNTYHMSIGQGDIATTPLAINQAIAVIASDGKLCKPQIVGDKKAGQVEQEECMDLELSDETIKLVKEGMIQACSTGGTGFTFFDFKEKYGIDVACKTGTAETFDNKDPHAWFVAFAPEKQAEIVITVLIENGGEGSRVAGPIAREIFDYWFIEKDR